MPQEQVAARGAAPQDPNARGPASTRSPTSPGFARVPGVILAPGVEVRPVELPVEGSWGEDPAPRYTRTQSPGGTPIPRTPTEPPARPGSQPPAGAPARPRTPLSSFPTSDLPPPPASVLGKNRPQGGAYSEVSALAKPSTGQEKTPSGRYLASRPSSPAATSRPPDGRSLFGDDLISEKSLDEVILSYLAEDLDTTPPKK